MRFLYDIFRQQGIQSTFKGLITKSRCLVPEHVSIPELSNTYQRYFHDFPKGKLFYFLKTIRIHRALFKPDRDFKFEHYKASRKLKLYVALKHDGHHL